MMHPTTAALACLALSSCATILARPTHVQITSTPSGIPFRTNHGQRGVTPATITPPRQDVALEVIYEPPGRWEREHYALVGYRRSRWVLGNILTGPVGMVGLVIDWSNPNVWVLRRDHVHWDQPPPKAKKGASQVSPGVSQGDKGDE